MDTAFASLIAAMSGAFPIEIINNTRRGIIMFTQGKNKNMYQPSRVYPCPVKAFLGLYINFILLGHIGIVFFKI